MRIIHHDVLFRLVPAVHLAVLCDCTLSGPGAECAGAVLWAGGALSEVQHFHQEN